ncbi:hypothetical protein [Nitrososphaera sp. AFS]|uniref:hypothetical protein n=1 Tax=Nitrososphaera sp. AFS TaxID=2301191 RepID=UPI001392256B|nr:hypothetical protein [Nitrososphaera sp. AFS]
MKARQVNAMHEMVSKWSRKAREIINQDHDWQRAIEKNPDKALCSIAKIIAKGSEHK